MSGRRAVRASDHVSWAGGGRRRRQAAAATAAAASGARRTLGSVGRQAAHKDLASLGLGLLRHALLGVDLRGRSGAVGRVAGGLEGGTCEPRPRCRQVPRRLVLARQAGPAAASLRPQAPHSRRPPCAAGARAAIRQTDLAAVDHVHVEHHGVGGRGAGKGYEAKAAGPARLAIAHHDLGEGREGAAGGQGREGGPRCWRTGSPPAPGPLAPHSPPPRCCRTCQSGRAASLRGAGARRAGGDRDPPGPQARPSPASAPTLPAPRAAAAGVQSAVRGGSESSAPHSPSVVSQLRPPRNSLADTGSGCEPGWASGWAPAPGPGDPPPSARGLEGSDIARNAA